MREMGFSVDYAAWFGRVVSVGSCGMLFLLLLVHAV